jgi:hypothetical protein
MKKRELKYDDRISYKECKKVKKKFTKLCKKDGGMSNVLRGFVRDYIDKRTHL